jgi:hypothetical protein
MTALSKFLVLLALFLSVSYASAFTSLSLVAGNQVWVNYLNQLQQPMSDQKMNQVMNQLTNQPNKWIWMQSFQVTFH